ncbi:DJ-1/PfpI family protein [Anaerocolumna sp. MB42-C2]|uniref:DJ-1/PfpI family protein n=1 Tax=Anaerocolumna sp. MB42-C2 TaxID=3070997 RepID=UPI0027E08A5D|nr:DJ-1/PfpI family protein [Anaerocolumna sp. MB42-C2]WMJ89621.1 DJ-1/PfpI family protein [Anaerocolumna sp. MB42-C2]
MKILLFLAKGFELMEFSPFIDIMGWANNGYGCDIQVVTCGFHNQVTSTFNIPVMVNKLIDDIKVDDYEALAIPGGFEEFGFYEEAYHEKFLQLIQAFNSKGKIIASVCVGALPIGKSGVLNGRNGTTYHLNGGHRQAQLRSFNVNVINEPIVTDNNIITSYCPETAPFVGFLLLEKLTSKEKTETVKKAMGY